MTKNNKPNEPSPPAPLTKVASNWPRLDGHKPDVGPDHTGPPAQDGGDRPSGEPRARRMLTERELLDLTRFSRTTLWRMEKAGTFPKG
jgi:hypothetical protein